MRADSQSCAGMPASLARFERLLEIVDRRRRRAQPGAAVPYYSIAATHRTDLATEGPRCLKKIAYHGEDVPA